MSLGIAFKGPEGIVLAADSRVTLNAQQSQPNGPAILIPATFDNATKLLKVKGQDFVGAVTYGVGAIGGNEPRTAHSFLPEFEALIAEKRNGERLKVEEFAHEFSDFFMSQWKRYATPVPPGLDMVFLVGGYDESAAYGRVFDFHIPGRPTPQEMYAGSGDFGLAWGGQREYVDRILQGFDQRTIDITQAELGIDQCTVDRLKLKLTPLAAQIPYPFLPLQDCVDLSIFLVKATMRIQTWIVGVRGVGGAVDVATITKTDGFRAIQLKQVAGERSL